MAGVGLLLRGVWPADSLFGNVVRLDFTYVGTSHDDYTLSVVFALYDVCADGDESWSSWNTEILAVRAPVICPSNGHAFSRLHI